MKYRAGRSATKTDYFGKPQRYPRAASTHIGLGMTQIRYAERDVIRWLTEKIDSKASRFKIFMPVFLFKGSATIAT